LLIHEFQCWRHPRYRYRLSTLRDRSPR
jgi:hypothetical protein